MQNGKLRHVVTIEKPVATKDEATGNDTVVWTPVPGLIRIRAEVLPDRAGEFFSARQIQATENALIRLHYQRGIDATMRAVFHVEPTVDEYFDIQGVIPFQERRRELRLMCLKRDAEGWRRGADLMNADLT